MAGAPVTARQESGGCRGRRASPRAGRRADIWLCFAPVKRARIDYIAEKATELGVAVLQPVITRAPIVERVNVERLRANAVEAAEQTERLSVPEVRGLSISRDCWTRGRPAGC